MMKKTSSVSFAGAANGNSPAGLSAEQLTEQNVETVTRLEEAAREQRTPSDCLAEKIASFCGSMRFVWVHVAWFGGWILLNSIPGIAHVDPFPFTFLTLIVSLEAIFLSTFILISEQENTKMIVMLHAIAARVGADLTQDPHLKALSEETQPERLIEQIEARESN
jgi:cation transport ATPase